MKDIGEYCIVYGKAPFIDKIIMCILDKLLSISTHKSVQYEEMHRGNAAINKYK